MTQLGGGFPRPRTVLVTQICPRDTESSPWSCPPDEAFTRPFSCRAHHLLLARGLAARQEGVDPRHGARRVALRRRHDRPRQHSPGRSPPRAPKLLDAAVCKMTGARQQQAIREHLDRRICGHFEMARDAPWAACRSGDPPARQAVDELCREASIPVINALDDNAHPCDPPPPPLLRFPLPRVLREPDPPPPRSYCSPAHPCAPRPRPAPSASVREPEPGNPPVMRRACLTTTMVFGGAGARCSRTC